LVTYYSNKANIDLYIANELKPEDVIIPFKNSLSSFEFDLGLPKYQKFVDLFKEKGFVFIDTETTRLDYTIGSLLSF
jgi:hypothetical protein